MSQIYKNDMSVLQINRPAMNRQAMVDAAYGGVLQVAKVVRKLIIVAAFAILILGTCIIAQAQPTQEQVLRSMSENVGQPTDGGKVLAAICGAVALIILLSLLHTRKARKAKPESFNHPAKLLKEISKAVELSPSQVKQLKVLAEKQQLSSPLTLLLCPSVTRSATREKRV